MPNWCFNNLKIAGKTKDLFKFHSQAIVADDKEPTKYVINDKKDEDNGKNDLLFGFEVEANVNEIKGELDDESNKFAIIYYKFLTPWSESKEAIEIVVQRYVDLDFTHIFEEPSFQYAGMREYREGKLIEEQLAFDDSFREFVYEQGLESYHKCNSCGVLLDDKEIYDNKFGSVSCIKCGSEDVLISED